VLGGLIPAHELARFAGQGDVKPSTGERHLGGRSHLPTDASYGGLACAETQEAWHKELIGAVLRYGAFGGIAQAVSQSMGGVALPRAFEL